MIKKNNKVNNSLTPCEGILKFRHTLLAIYPSASSDLALNKHLGKYFTTNIYAQTLKYISVYIYIYTHISIYIYIYIYICKVTTRYP